MDLYAIARGRKLSTRPLLVGELQHRLRAERDGLADLVADSVDRELRNAEAHETYRVVAGGNSIVLEDGRSFGPEELADAVETLVACVAGLDAGFACFCFDRELMNEPPAWLTGDRTHAAVEQIVRTLFAGYGVGVLALERKLGIVRFDVRVSSRVLAGGGLFNALAGAAGLIRDASVFEARSEDGDVVIRVDAEAWRLFREAPAEFKDLAAVLPNMSASLGLGRPRVDTILDGLAMSIALVVTQMGALRGSQAFTLLARQLAFVREHVGSLTKATAVADPIGKIRVLQKAAADAAYGDLSAAASVREGLDSLMAWAHTRRFGQALLDAAGCSQLTVSRGAPLLRPLRVGRNDPCPCGSGKKHKRCCLN